MARSITFKGQTQFKPGGLTNVDANALTPIGISATGVVHLLGEADGGPPGSSAIAIIDDPELARSTYRSGPLADAIRIAFNPSGDPRILGGAFRVVAYKTNASTQSGTTLPGDEGRADTSTGASTTTVITLTTGGLTPDAEIGRWLQLDNTSERRRIIDNDATTITVSPAYSAAPINTDPVTILDNQMLLTSADYGSHTNQVSVELEAGAGEGVVVTLVFEDTVEQSDEIAGEAKLRVKYVGGPVLDSGNVDSISSDGLTVTVDVSAAPGANAWDALVLRFSDGTQRLIDSHTTADPAVITLDAAHALSAADQAALVNTTAEIVNVTAATASITGANGAATALTTTVTPVAEDITVTFATENITTLRELRDYLNGNTNFEAVIPNGVNPDTTLLVDFDFGTRNTGVDVRFDDEISPDTNGSFRQDLVTVINWINDFSVLATAERSSTLTDEGSELPLNTGGLSGSIRDVPVFFIGGTRGISSNTDFQNGFDRLIQERGNHIVPLIAQDLTNEGNGSTATFDSVLAQLKTHVQNAATTAKNEQGGYIGFKGTLANWLAACAAANNADIQVFSQRFAFLNVAGTLTTQDEWSSAVAAAGMRAGAEVGQPLTYKVINTLVAENDASWSPTSITDVNSIIQGGGMFAEVTQAGAVRWVRDLTSYLLDDNIAFIDGNTRDAVRFVAYDLREFLENRFTGTKATPATVASVREAVVQKMAEYLTNEIIVESLDPETQTTLLPGFRSLRVFLEGNVATVRVEIFPVTGVVFIPIDLTLQLPRIAA